MDGRIEKLKKLSTYIRTKSLGVILNANNGHIGGNMSSVELLTALYFGGLFNFDPDDSKNENRERILIRGHEGPLRYTIFSLLGYLKEEELVTYRQLGTRLHGHEDMHETPGIDITPSGSLGMVLSYGVGSAIANKDKKLDCKTIVFLGDGEEQEGNVAEAARHATTLDLNNLICIIDANKKQLSRSTEESDGHDIRKIWEGYGWDVLEIENGNDIVEVLETYKKLGEIKKPTLVIAHTTKGYGVKGALEHFSGYHTLSSAFDKNQIIESYNQLKEILSCDFNHEEMSKLAIELVKKPVTKEIKKDKLSPEIFDIRTSKSDVSPQVAHEDYLMKIKDIIGKTGKENIYYITPDLYRKPEVNELGYNEFMHFIDTGIREQHAVAMAHGISVENPEARLCLCFGDAFIYRALDQINAAVIGKSNMTIIGVWPGIQGAQNGKTHQTISQPGSLMSIPELNFYEPADAVDLYNIFSEIFTKNKGVNYVRLSKDSIKLKRNLEDIKNTTAYYVFKESEKPDALIVSSGFILENAVNAAKQLKVKYNLSINVMNIVNAKKFKNYAEKLITNDCPILSIYNGSPYILPQYICSAIIENPNIPRPKKFETHGFLIGNTGSYQDLINYYGFDKENIKQKVLKLTQK